MPATGIESARHKLRRARQHAEEFERALAAFEATEPLQYETQWRPEDESEDEIACTVVVTKSDDPPDSFSVIIGDCLTNLRAALDHAVFEHARKQYAEVKKRALTEREERSLYFPLAQSPGGLTKARTYLAPKVHEYVTSLHDFVDDWKSTDSTIQHLALLRIFVNYDKHRAIVPGNQADAHIKATVASYYIRSLGFEFVPGEALVGNVLLTMRFQKLQPLTDVPRDQLVTGLTIKFPTMLRIPEDSAPPAVEIDTLPPPNAVERLHGMCDAVGSVLDELERLGV